MFSRLSLLSNHKYSGFVPADSSVKQDNLQDGPGQIAAEIMSGSPNLRELPDFRQNRMQPGNTCLLPVFGDHMIS